MAFLKLAGSDLDGMGKLVGTTDAEAPELDEKSVGTRAMLTDPATGETHLLLYTGDEDSQSEVTGWTGWVDMQ